MYPHESLVFDFASKDQPKSILHLKNTSTHDIFFKLKTTAPKTYQVKPSQGKLNPSEKVKIILTIQPSETVSGCIKDKFLVEASKTSFQDSKSVQRAKLGVSVHQTAEANLEVTQPVPVTEIKEEHKQDIKFQIACFLDNALILLLV